MRRLRAYIEYKLYMYCYLLPEFLYDKAAFPSKFLVKYYFELDPRGTENRHRVGRIAHMYCYYRYIDRDNLELIHSVYATNTRERVRQILAKYIRTVRAHERASNEC